MKYSILSLLLLAVLSSSAHAVVLFENSYSGGGGNYQFSFNGANTIGAENFTLSGDSTIDTVSFTAHTNNLLPTTIDWWIFGDLSNAPGSTIYSGSTASYTSVVIAPYLSGGIRDYSIDVGALALTAGDYWVGFSPNGIDGNIHWSFAGSGDGNSALTSNGGTTWSTPYPGTNMTFRVEGNAGTVPEPSALALMGLGLLGFVGARRKIKK